MATAASGPRASGRQPPPPPPEALPSVAEHNSRRTSLGFLRRTKSTEPLAAGKASKKSKEQQAKEEELQRQRQSSYVPQHAPRLPSLSPAPQLATFGGEERPDSVAIICGVTRMSSPLRNNAAPPPIPVGSPVSTGSPDPYARTESMTHRGRYSYASSAVSSVNSPRRLRRRKDPTPYNILVIGARNSGKTSFLNFLRKSLVMPSHKHQSRPVEELENFGHQSSAYEGYISNYLETEIDGERIGVTLWDSAGLERNIVDIQLQSVAGFLESKFEETLTEEMKVVRSPGVRDTHIHCTFLLLDPVNLDANIAAAERAANGSAKASDPHVTGVLDESLDIQVLRAVLGKTTVVPVISKADTITTTHMAYLKKAVWDSLKKANIDPLEILTLEDQEEEYSSSESGDEDEEGKSEDPETPLTSESPVNGGKLTPTSQSESSAPTANPIIPFSTLSPDPYSFESEDQPVGRKFPWGFADPYDPEHCDFVKLKDAVFTDWRSELREASREVWYERWRTNRLNTRNGALSPKKQVFGGRAGPLGDGRRAR